MEITLSRDEARARMVAHHGLARIDLPKGAAGVRALLDRLRCIQLDPLDVLGTNADLVALARVDGIARGDVYKHLLPGYAFEHYAKERCLLPADAFPQYREQAATMMARTLSSRMAKLTPAQVDAVLAEVRRDGPVSAQQVSDQGRVDPHDYNGWKGTARASLMALEVLWADCRVVVSGRVRNGKLYDVPERALPKHAQLPAQDFDRWAITQRVMASGLIARMGSPAWSILAKTRATDLPDRLVEEGALVRIRLEGAPRPYLTVPDFLSRKILRTDSRMRILGPLDAMLWDRDLVRRLFDFDYVWEVYKPASLRRWGWYVCPLLHRGQLVGRLEGQVEGDVLRVKTLWREKSRDFDEDALDAALARHALACGATRVKRPRRR